MSYAPIVLFAFNRLEPLKRCVVSLLENSEAMESDLIVYVDGPRPDREGESEKVKSVCEFVMGINGFKSLETHFSKINRGLGQSLIAGITDVINRYGKVIVVEDDLIVSRNFLAYINSGIVQYEHYNNVWSICGFGLKVKTPKDYNYDTYFCTRSSSWGWATWKDRWSSCDWELKDWTTVECNARDFNRWGGSDCYGMLQGWHEGKNQSWAIRFCYNQFVQGKVSLFPVISHVNNTGFDGHGTNCKKWSRFVYVFDDSENKNFACPQSTQIVESIRKKVMSYHSIRKRIYSRIMYMIYG